MSKTILVVEDNEMNMDMLTRRLQRRGYTVIGALNGVEGVAKARAERPNLILMDMSLPVMDGWEATRTLKADPETRSIPIMALTAHSIAGDREKCLAVGCDEYESKPVRFPQLMEKIKAFIGE
jgi:two-component system cell cycle response regulator DivK